MKKLTILLLIFCVVFASCKKKLGTDASQSGAGNPSDLIDDKGNSSITTVTAFINHYAGVYYSQGKHSYRTWDDNEGYKVDYKLKDGKVYVANMHNQLDELIIQPVEAVLESEKKLQLRNAEKGEVLVLNITETGLETYVSYILEKVSDDVLIDNSGIGGKIAELAAYKGTYNSLAEDNKIENYIAIDGEGNIFFHDATVTIEGGKATITDGGELTILESYNNAIRKIIFKFDQGVYRRFAIDGPREGIDETYIGICEMTKDFIEDRFDDAKYQTADYKEEDFQTWYNEVPGGQQYPTKITGVDIKLNEKNDSIGHEVSEGAVAISGNDIGENKGLSVGNMVGHVTVLKGNTLHIMGRFNAEFVFSDDWQTATYNGQTLKLVSGSVKNVDTTARKTSSFIPLKRR